MAHTTFDDAALIGAHAEARATPRAATKGRALLSWHVVAALSVVCTDNRDAIADAVFAAFDVDQSGILDLAELERYLATALAFSQHLHDLATYDACKSRAGHVRAECNARGKCIARAMVGRTFSAASTAVTKADFLAWLSKIVGHPPGFVDWDDEREAAWQVGEVDSAASVMAAYG